MNSTLKFIAFTLFTELFVFCEIATYFQPEKIGIIEITLKILKEIKITE